MSFSNLKHAIETFDSNNSDHLLKLEKIDEIFQKVVIDNQSDLIKSLDLVEDFLLETLNNKKLSLKL